jgi:hypothetical protein
MARALRITFPGAFYHVTSRGNERKNIFKSKRDDFVKSQNCDGKVIPPGRDQIQGARILCHTANAVPEGCVLSVRRNDNEMKRNAVPLKRDLRSHQT